MPPDFDGYGLFRRSRSRQPLDSAADLPRDGGPHPALSFLAFVGVRLLRWRLEFQFTARRSPPRIRQVLPDRQCSVLEDLGTREYMSSLPQYRGRDPVPGMGLPWSQMLYERTY